MKTHIASLLIALVLTNGVALAQRRPPRPDRQTRQEVSRLEREAAAQVQRPNGAESAADLYLQAFDRIPRCVYLANAARLLSGIDSRRGGARQYVERVVQEDCQVSRDRTEIRLATELLAELGTPPVTPVPVPPPVVVVPPVVPPTPPVAPVVVTRPPVLPPVLPPLVPPVRRPVPGVAIGFWAAGGVSLLAGALSLAWHVDAQNELNKTANADLGRWQQASDAALVTSLASFGAALVFGGIGTMFFLRRPSVPVLVTPVASPTHAGLAFTLRF